MLYTYLAVACGVAVAVGGAVAVLYTNWSRWCVHTPTRPACTPRRGSRGSRARPVRPPPPPPPQQQQQQQQSPPLRDGVEPHTAAMFMCRAVR